MPKIDNSLIGAAGVHFVVSELSLRGLIALPTIRNTAGIDVVVVNKSGTWHANLQVKASKNKVTFWPIGNRYKEWHGENNWYTFVISKTSRDLKSSLNQQNALQSKWQRTLRETKNAASLNGHPIGSCQRVMQSWSVFGVSGLSSGTRDKTA